MKEYRDDWEQVEELSDMLEGQTNEDLSEYEDLLKNLQMEDDKE